MPIFVLYGVIQIEYNLNTNRGEAKVCIMACISRTNQRMACITLMPVLCRNHPPLDTSMPDKTTDMHSSPSVQYTGACRPCTCTCSISNGSRYLPGYKGNVELLL